MKENSREEIINSIEEIIKQLELILKVRKEQKEIIECAGGSCMNCDPDIKALTESIKIVSDYKRVLKENELLRKDIEGWEKYCEEIGEEQTEMSNKNCELEFEVEKLQKENKELKFKERSRIIGKYGDVEIQDVINRTLSNDYISVKKIQDIIDRIDYDIKKIKEIISNNSNIYTSDRRNDYQIVRLRAMNTKSLDIKKRLQELIEESGEK